MTAHSIIFILIRKPLLSGSFLSLYSCPLPHTPCTFMRFYSLLVLCPHLYLNYISMSIQAPYSSKRHSVFPGKMTYFRFGHHLNTPGCLSGSREVESKKSLATGRGEMWHPTAHDQDDRARIDKHLPVVSTGPIAPETAIPKSSPGILCVTSQHANGLPNEDCETPR